MIKKLAESFAAENRGAELAENIINGDYDGITGLNKLLNKGQDSDFFHALNHTLKSSNRAAKNGIPKNRHQFEDEVIARPDDNPPVEGYDVDFGIKSLSGTIKFETGYQLKSVATPNSAKNAITRSKLQSLLRSPSSNKIYEVELRSGTFTELEGISQFWTNLNNIRTYHTPSEVTILVRLPSGESRNY